SGRGSLGLLGRRLDLFLFPLLCVTLQLFEPLIKGQLSVQIFAQLFILIFDLLDKLLRSSITFNEIVNGCKLLALTHKLVKRVGSRSSLGGRLGGFLRKNILIRHIGRYVPSLNSKSS